jgi:hypothetical protein
LEVVIDLHAARPIPTYRAVRSYLSFPISAH